MSQPKQTNEKLSGKPAGGLLQSGIIFTVAQFLTLLIGFGFQMTVRRRLSEAGEFGYVQTTIIFIGFLALPLTIAGQAVTHYIARFHFGNDDARLQGLLAGCRKFLFHITVVGSVIVLILIKPLGDFFHIPRITLTFVALVCVLAQLWAAYLSALCQGLGWFKRLAAIGLLAAVIRFSFGVSATAIWPIAEWAVLASAIMLLSNLILFLWKEDFPHKTDAAVLPWTKEFIQFLVVSSACVFGSSCFGQYDGLVAQRYFHGTPLDNYTAAGLLARQIPSLVGPFLAVLFTHRSGGHHHHGDALREQLKLLGLFALGLMVNAVGLCLLKTIGLRLIGQNTTAAADMIPPFSVTMVFVGLLQAIGIWALASRWIKISVLYGAMGFIYWVTLLIFGHSPAELLRIMPIAAGIAFAVVFLVWLVAMRSHKTGAPEES